MLLVPLELTLRVKTAVPGPLGDMSISGKQLANNNLDERKCNVRMDTRE